MNSVNQNVSRLPSNPKIWHDYFLVIISILIGWNTIKFFQFFQIVQTIYDVLGDSPLLALEVWSLIGEVGIIIGSIGIVKVKKWGYILFLLSFLLCIVINLYSIDNSIYLDESLSQKKLTVTLQCIIVFGVWKLIYSGKAAINGINPFKKVDQPSSKAINHPQTITPSQKMNESSTPSNKLSKQKNEAQYRVIPTESAPWEKNISQSNGIVMGEFQSSTQSSLSQIQSNSSFLKEFSQNASLQSPSSKTKEKTFSSENPRGSLCVCGATLTPNQKFCSKCGRPT